MLPFRAMQLADSAFPSGGFAHSAGLESFLTFAREPPEVGSLAARFAWGVGNALLPFASAAWDEPDRLAALSATMDAFLVFPAVQRASQAQGRALAGAAARIYGGKALSELAEAVRRRELSPHLAPVFGAVFAHAGIERDATQAAFLFTQVRGFVSAAVRLGVVGPFEGQRIQDGLPLGDILGATKHLREDDAADTDPVFSLYAALHDQLTARMFQS